MNEKGDPRNSKCDPCEGIDRAPKRSWTLLDAGGRPYLSAQPGIFGGHRKTHIYGRLDCPSALRAIARGGYVPNRVFFLDEFTAIAAGYRPCSVCLPERYAAWKSDPDAFKTNR